MRNVLFALVTALFILIPPANAQNSTPLFRIKFSETSISRPVAMADFDKDGNVDIISVEYDSTGSVLLGMNLNDGANSFTRTQTVALLSGSFSGIVVRPTNKKKTPFEIRLNINTLGKEIGYLISVTKSGAFKKPKKKKSALELLGSAFLAQPAHSTPNDIDGDGLPETFSTEESANGPSLIVSSSRGGAPHYYQLTLPTAFTNIQYDSVSLMRVITTDVDFDGDTDLIALFNFRAGAGTGPGVARNYWRLFHFRNDGTGTFPVKTYKDLPYDTVTFPSSALSALTVTDLNADGRPEFLFFNSSSLEGRYPVPFLIISEASPLNGVEGIYQTVNLQLDPNSSTRCASSTLTFDFVVRPTASGFEVISPRGQALTGSPYNGVIVLGYGNSSGRYHLSETLTLRNISAESADLSYSYSSGSSIGDPFTENCSYSYSGVASRN